MALALREIRHKAPPIVGISVCYTGGPNGEYAHPDGSAWADLYIPSVQLGTITGIASPFAYEEYIPNNIFD